VFQPDIDIPGLPNSVYHAISFVSIAINAYFIRGTVEDIRALRKDVGNHSERLAIIDGKTMTGE
jgi:hypothetical protein